MDEKTILFFDVGGQAMFMNVTLLYGTFKIPEVPYNSSINNVTFIENQKTIVLIFFEVWAFGK